MGESVEQSKEDRKIAKTIDDLPKLKEGFMRLVHVSRSPRALEMIPNQGLNYKSQGMVSSTASTYSKEEDVEYFSKDPRFSTGWSYIFDLPINEHRIHENFTKAPGIVPAKYLVGVIEKH